MRAVAIDRFGGPEQLRIVQLDDPRPRPGEVLVRVEAAGVNTTDWKVVEGRLAEVLPHAFPLVPGWDAAGVIEAVGDGVGDWAPGDEIYTFCRKPTVQWGTFAERLTVSAAHIARKPKSLDFARAAAVPMAALTAWQALVDVARLCVDEVVLIQGAAGGVGNFAVQLAHRLGATVVGTAREADHAWCKRLGAATCIDVERQDLVAAVLDEHPSGVNVVLDTVGGDALRRASEVLAEGGRLLSTVQRPELGGLGHRGIHGAQVFAEPSGQQLGELAWMADAAELVVHLDAVLPLAEADRALALSHEGRVRGKLALLVGRD